MSGRSVPRVSLDGARWKLAEACAALAGWYDREGNPVGYVGDGHVALRLVDELARELCRVRVELLSEMRTDAEARAVRLAGLLAEWRSSGSR